jgi:Uma2 family endonuclease
MAVRRPAPSFHSGRRMTRAEYFAGEESMLPTNLIDGELIVLPTPRMRHQDIVGRLFRALSSFEDAVGGKVILSPMDVELGEDAILQPDLAYIAPGSSTTCEEHVVGPPDLVIEVLSPNYRPGVHQRKMEKYARYGVREAWVIDAKKPETVVLANDAGAWRETARIPFGEDILSAIVSVNAGRLER